MSETYRKLVKVQNLINDKAENNATLPAELLIEYYDLLKKYHEEKREAAKVS